MVNDMDSKDIKPLKNYLNDLRGMKEDIELYGQSWYKHDIDGKITWIPLSDVGANSVDYIRKRME